MATDRLPFPGNTSAAIFGAILHQAAEPPLRLNPELPLKLEEIVSKALEKDRDLRYQHASDMRTDLKRLRRDTDSGRSTGVLACCGLGVSPQHPRRVPRAECPRDSGQDARATSTLAARCRGRACYRWCSSGLPLDAPLARAKVSNYVQLTHDGEPKGLPATDGSRLYFNVGSGPRQPLRRCPSQEERSRESPPLPPP